MAVDSALYQPAEDGGKDHPIAFANKQLSAAERNYTTTEQKCLAMVFSVKKYRHYLLMNPIVSLWIIWPCAIWLTSQN
jgi:hypothetical protein